LTGPTGSSVFASSGTSTMTTAVSAAGVIYFQPDGRATTDGAGSTTANRTVTPAGLSAISIIGETGHAE
jgi:MSHA pilin protein MshC